MSHKRAGKRVILYMWRKNDELRKDVLMRAWNLLGRIFQKSRFRKVLKFWFCERKLPAKFLKKLTRIFNCDLWCFVSSQRRKRDKETKKAAWKTPEAKTHSLTSIQIWVNNNFNPDEGKEGKIEITWTLNGKFNSESSLYGTP